MCTNKYTLDLVTLMNKSEIDDMKSENNFIEIFHETPEGWKRDCYNRSELLRLLQIDWDDTITFWNDGSSKNRVKAVYKFPYSGEFFTEDSVRLLTLSHFNQFRKVDCNEYALGSYFFQSSLHGEKRTVCKLEPLIELSNTDSVNIQDEGILSIQLRKIPEEIFERPLEVTQQEKELIRLEQEQGDISMVDKEESSSEKKQRHAEERERVFSRLYASREYDVNSLPFESHIFQRDRVVVYNIETNDITLEQWLLVNNFDPSIYTRLHRYISNLIDLDKKTDQDLISYGLSESEADLILSKYLYDQIDLDNTFKHCYTVREIPSMPNRYYERYCFTSPKTPEDIFFKTPNKRIEYRGFHHIGPYRAAETKLLSSDSLTFKITADQYSYIFGLFLLDNKYNCYVVKQNGESIASKIATLSTNVGPHPVNHFTMEQFIRTSALVFLLLTDIDINDEVLSLIKLLSMNISKTMLFVVYEEYISTLLMGNNNQENINNVYNRVLRLFNNDDIHKILGEFDDNYIIEKNMFLILLLKYISYNHIYNEDENSTAILKLANRSFGGFYKDIKNNNPMNLILQNSKLSADQMIEAIKILHDSFNVDYQSENNLYSTMITYSSFENYIPLANLFFDNNVDPIADDDNLSTLHRAAIQGDSAAPLVKWLIEKGADVNRVGTTGDIIANPFELVAYLSHNDMIPTSKQVLRLLKNAGSRVDRSPYETLKKDEEGGIQNIIYNIVYIVLNLKTREEFDFVCNYISFLNDVNITFKGYYNFLTAFINCAFFSEFEDENDLDTFMNILQEKGFDFKQVDDNGYTPALFALSHKEYILPNFILQIIERDPSVVSIHSTKNISILQRCIEHGDEHLQIVETVASTDMNEVFNYFTVTNKDSTTYNSHAIKYAYQMSENENISNEIYNYLLKVSKMNDFYFSLSNNEIPISSEEFKSLFFSAESSQKLKRLLSVDIFESNILIVMIKACANNKLSDDNDFKNFENLVELYLLEGGNINLQDAIKASVLFWAVTKEYPLRVIKYLIKKGCNPDLPGSQSVLSLADRINVNDSYQDVVDYLESKGASRFESFTENEEENNEEEEYESAYFRHREEDEEEEEVRNISNVRRNLFGFKDLNSIKKYY